MYHYVYKVEDILSGEYYIGSRSSKVHPSIDSYMGSMCTWKPNKMNLRKEIIKDDFISRCDAIKYEGKYIKKCINDPLNRNYHIPGMGYHTHGKTHIIDENGVCKLIDCEEYHTGNYVSANKNKVVVVNSDNDIYMTSVNDPLYKTKKVKFIHTGKVVVEDEFGRKFQVNKNDTLYLSGYYKFIWTGKKHKPETIEKMKSHNGKSLGEKNSQYGTMWIYNAATKENKKIKKTDIIPDAWVKGRYFDDKFAEKIKKISKNQTGEKNSQHGTMWIYNAATKENKKIKKTDIIPDGWVKGRKIKKN